MALSTYDNLIAEVPDFAMRTGDTEFAARVPTFIRLFEARVNRTLRVAEMEAVAAGVTDADGYCDLPTDYLEWRGVTAANRCHGALEYVSPDADAMLYPHAGVPRHFTVIGRQLRTYPIGSGAIQLAYYARVPSLSQSAQTNWLLAKAPDLYLFGCLSEAAPYMEEDQRVAVWEAKLANAMNDLRANDAGARYASGRSRVRGPTP